MKPWRFPLMALALLALSLSACAPRVVTVTVTVPPETVVVTASPEPTAAPSPAPKEPRTLNVCLVGEPDTLYLYGGSRLPATRHVMEGLYDGPIDHRDFAYQPVILEKLPSLADGDALIRKTYVRRGDRVIDADGELVTVAEGVQLRPSGCMTSGCEVTFEGGIVPMDRLEVTFAVRKDVTWADGVPLTAEDSAFGFKIASDPATPAYRELIERTTTYRAVDEWHTEWIGVPGFIDPSYAVRFFPPLPRHRLEGRSAGELLEYEGTRREPLGWGPFVVEEWVQGDHITLTRNTEYFRADEGLPHLDRVVFKVMVDEGETLASLVSGACDIGTHDAELAPWMPLVVRLEEHGLLQIAASPGREMALLSFGIEPSPEYERPDFFGEERVRQAIARCIDRQALVDEMTYGFGVAPDSYVPPSHPRYPAGELVHWQHDSEAGRALLDEIGWRDTDNDGVREAEGIEGVDGGARFEVMLLTSGDSPASLETARILRAQLADCGIRATVDARPRSELLAEGPSGPLSGRRFDLAVTRWMVEDRLSCERYLSSQIPREDAWSGANVTGYMSSRYDAGCRLARRALPGSSGYDRYHEEAQTIFSQDLPALPLFVSPRIALARPMVENLEMDGTSESELWNVESLDISAEAVLR